MHSTLRFKQLLGMRWIVERVGQSMPWTKQAADSSVNQAGSPAGGWARRGGGSSPMGARTGCRGSRQSTCAVVIVNGGVEWRRMAGSVHWRIWCLPFNSAAPSSGAHLAEPAWRWSVGRQEQEGGRGRETTGSSGGGLIGVGGEGVG